MRFDAVRAWNFSHQAVFAKKKITILFICRRKLLGFMKIKGVIFNHAHQRFEDKVGIQINFFSRNTGFFPKPKTLIKQPETRTPKP